MERMMSQAPDLLSIPVNSRSAPPMFKVPVQMTPRMPSPMANRRIVSSI